MPSKLIKIFILILFLVVVSETAALTFPKIKDLTAVFNKSSSFEKLAEKIISACKNDNYRPSCYDKEIPKVMDNISLEDAFKVTRIVQDKDPEYQYCHVLGHELSAREVRKDPSKWKDVVTRCPSGMCSNGCIHGGFQERFRAEYLTAEELPKIKNDLLDLCEKRGKWDPTGLEQASCYHALGHLTMYITNADIPNAIKLCEESALKPDGRDFRQLCFDGVFMQIFQPLEPEDFALVKGKQPTQAEVLIFCGKYSDKKKASCLSESWPLHLEELKEPSGIVNFCGMTEERERPRCYNAIFYVLTAQFNFDLEKIKSYCLGLPLEIQGRCFANASSRMIETDYRNATKSVSLCNSAPEGAKETCFKEMLVYSIFNFHKDSEEFVKLCETLPDPWKDSCFNKKR